MSVALRLSDGGYMRKTDIEQIIRMLCSARCVEVTGFSNVGKSSLMRLLAQADVWLHHLGEEGGAYLPVYIDCNRILDMSDQGFYELVLRCLRESSPALAADSALQTAYEGLVAPSNDFQVPLNFSNGLTAALQNSHFNLILLFDEFDEPFQEILPRVFLNLRAKKDLFGNRLMYVTATVWPLAELWPGEHSGEFGELFSHQPWHLGPLPHHDVEHYMRSFAEHNDVELSSQDVDFAYSWTGGHPGYLEGVSKLLGGAASELERQGDDEKGRWALHRDLADQLRQDPTLHTESEKIWHSCMPDHQEALRSLFSSKEADSASLALLMKHHILKHVKEELRVFSRLFAEYVLAFQTDTGAPERPQIEFKNGEFVVGGRLVELSRLEFRLLSLLHEKRSHVVEKFEIVMEVWGENYLDEVDDARIEKLVSRLRQKIEPDPANPVLVITIRGRGYRLQTGPGNP